MWPHVKCQKSIGARTFPWSLTIESCYVSTGTGTGKEEVGLWGRRVSGIAEHDLIHRPSFHPNISAVIWIMETHGWLRTKVTVAIAAVLTLGDAGLDESLRAWSDLTTSLHSSYLDSYTAQSLRFSWRECPFLVRMNQVSTWNKENKEDLSGCNNFILFFLPKYMLLHISQVLNCVIGPSVHWNFLFMCILQSYVMETFCLSCESVIFKKRKAL